MKPELHIVGLTIHTYGLAFVAAYAAATLVAARQLEEQRWPARWAGEAAFIAVIAGLVGARLLYAAEHPSELTADPVHAFVRGSGFSWYGGFVGALVALLPWSLRRGVFSLRVIDACAVPLALGQAVLRIGCQLAGDGDYGKDSTLPWAMGYPHGTAPTRPGETVHPTPVYETLALGLIALWLWRRRASYKPGVLAGSYLVLAGMERFLVEFVRRNPPDVAGLTQAQVISLALIAAGLTLTACVWERGHHARHEVSPV